jgi:hypothetical protein
LGNQMYVSVLAAYVAVQYFVEKDPFSAAKLCLMAIVLFGDLCKTFVPFSVCILRHINNLIRSSCRVQFKILVCGQVCAKFGQTSIH